MAVPAGLHAMGALWSLFYKQADESGADGAEGDDGTFASGVHKPNNSNNSNNSRVLDAETHSASPLDQMVQRVRDVLPQVPVDVIRRDLTVTGCVEESITRLLDGSVKYTPETVASSSSSCNASLPNVSNVSNVPHQPLDAANISLNTAAKTFGKNAADRMKSYAERKQALIDAARLRYIAKHGLAQAK